MLDKISSFIPFFSKDIDLRDAEKKKFYLQSLILFIVLLLLIADYCFSIEGKVRMIVGEKNFPYIINTLEVIFCCLIVLLVLTVIMIIVSTILYVIFNKVSDSKNWNGDKVSRVEYLHRISLGSRHRFRDTVDWFLIVLIPLYKWDYQFVLDVTNQVTDLIRIILCIFIGLVALTSTIWEIINRFFCLWSDIDTNTKPD